MSKKQPFDDNVLRAAVEKHLAQKKKFWNRVITSIRHWWYNCTDRA